jgi:hypothetical protein
MTRKGLAIVMAFVVTAGVRGAGTIEPLYQSKTPKYCILAFGPSPSERVLLVHDGDVLYVDRTANGNLTEAGKRVTAEKKPDRNPEQDGYEFQAGDLTVAGRTHKGLSIWFVPLTRYADGSNGRRDDARAALLKDPRALAAIIRLDVSVPGMNGGGLDGRLEFDAGPFDLNGALQFADSPDRAPVINFANPWQITFERQRPALRVGASTTATLVIGSPGTGPGTFAELGYEHTVPAGARPVLELSIPSVGPDKSPIHQIIPIKGRC